MNFFDFDDEENYPSPEELEKALKHYRSLLQNISNKNFESESIYFELENIEVLIDYLIEENRFNEALEFANYLVELVPYSSSFLLRKGIALHNIFKEQEAEEVLQKALSLDPTNIEILFQLSYVLDSQGKLKSSLEILDQILLIAPNDPDALFNKATLLISLGKTDEAIPLLNQLVHTKEYALDAYEELAQLYYFIGKYELAIEHNKKALELNPFNADLWFQLGASYFELGSYYRAIESFQNTISLDNEYNIAYLSIGDSFASLGKFYQALHFYKIYAKKENNDPEVTFKIASIYGQLEKYQRAIQIFNRIRKSSPNQPEVYYGLSLCYKFLKNYKLALKLINKAIELHPKNQDFLLEKARLLALLHRNQSAKKFYEMVLASNDTKKIYEYALFLIKTKDYGSAYAHLRLVTSLTNENKTNFLADAYYLQGFCLAKIKDFKESLRVLNIAIRLYPQKFIDFSSEFTNVLPNRIFKFFKKKLDPGIFGDLNQQYLITFGDSISKNFSSKYNRLVSPNRIGKSSHLNKSNT